MLSAAKIAFIARHAPAVRAAVAGTGVLPSVAMAQMIIESSIGQGLTVRAGNNYFGIKADAGWRGEKILLPTPRDKQKQSWFRVYASAEDSLRDHARFLRVNPRYTRAGVFAAPTPAAQAAALDAAGYAGDSAPGTYARALQAEIRQYSLATLDAPLDATALLTPAGWLAGAAVAAAGGFWAHRRGWLRGLGFIFPFRRH